MKLKGKNVLEIEEYCEENSGYTARSEILTPGCEKPCMCCKQASSLDSSALVALEIQEGEIPAFVLSERKWGSWGSGAKLNLEIPEVNI